MATIFNILQMHRSQELTETLRAYEEQRANERAEKHAAMVLDVCQEIRDYMTQEEYNAWFEAAPEEGFFSAACDQLLSMKRPASFQDGRVDVTKYFNGIPATASKTWAGRHLNNS